MLKNALYGLLFATTTLVGLSSAVAARELTTDEKQVIADTVRGRLRDPASASFKWGNLTGVGNKVDNTASAVYCGYVNSRNAYGGFVGDKPFSSFVMLVDGKVVSAVVLGIGGTRLTTTAEYNFCSENGYGPSYFARVR
ncbi:MAG: hypothetical protein COA62_15515 [Rhodobiaceae bacterium]|nr:MAG: hypothetical protein COA62_15515 [Rhodobiaceae bacterium]